MEEYPDFWPEYIGPDTVRTVYESDWDRLGNRPSIIGGELFLHPEIEEFIRYLDDCGASSFVNSNLITIGDCVKQINTSIDHVHAEKHDGQRGGFFSFIEALSY